MNFREFKEYMEERLDKEKFEAKTRISIEENNREIEEAKYRVKDKNIPIVIKQNWENMLKGQYDSIRRTLSENEIVEQTNSSFSEY